MVKLALIRHGPTDWNRQKLVQGSTDVPLGAEGEKEVAAWNMPSEFFSFNWLSSPLARAQQTAELLRGAPVVTDSRLAEMAWGDWEGKVLADLRSELGELMAAWEAKGLDFRGPGGESPREVQKRVRPLLAELAEAGEDTVAVCHKGVIRAIYALAAAWDMTAKPPHKLLDGCIQLVDLGPNGDPSISMLNIRMIPHQ